jgi:hypothetical protein
MANKTEDRLLSLFKEASGNQGSDLTAAPAKETLGRVDSASDYAGPAGLSAFDPASEGGPGQGNRGISGASSSSGNSSSGGNSLESIVGSVFGGALGLIPLVGSLFGLFGGKSTPQQTFQKYEMPSSISFEAADTGSGLVNADYGQMGLPRLYAAPDASEASPGSGQAAGAATPSGAAGGFSAGGQQAGMPNISVNVQAMDAQSFMSYSGEIAKAVRDAMLNLSAVNDVVSEL